MVGGEREGEEKKEEKRRRKGAEEEEGEEEEEHTRMAIGVGLPFGVDSDEGLRQVAMVVVHQRPSSLKGYLRKVGERREGGREGEGSYYFR